MEEAKAAAYYDELTRKGEGAARFKQGLGFSSKSEPSAPSKASSSSSSFLSTFVRASSPGKAVEIEKQVHVEKIQNKLKKKPQIPSIPSNRSNDAGGSGNRQSGEHRDRHHSRSPSRKSRDRHRSHSRERDVGRGSRHRHRSRSRGREDVEGRSRKRRSHSRSASEEVEEENGGGRRNLYGEREREDYRLRRARRSRSPPASSKSGVRVRVHRDSHSGEIAEYSKREDSGRRDSSKDKVASIDFSQLIEGYSQMTPAERVKAKMKLQLSQTAAKDMANGKSRGWERFDFNKEAPLDDEEIEVEVEDDEAVLAKDRGRSFRFSAIQAKREEEIKDAHDEAMFGAASASSPAPLEKEPTEENDTITGNKNDLNNDALISDKVLAMQQQGSWRDRAARKLQNGARN